MHAHTLRQRLNVQYIIISEGTLLIRIGFSGGGILRLTVDTTLEVEGVIQANGAPGTGSYTGGASGGSIFITTREMEGEGQIQVSFGSYTVNPPTI